MVSGKLKVATCQFAVGASVEDNCGAIYAFIEDAAAGGAEIVHFSECALSGYASIDHPHLYDYDWDLLITATEKIKTLAAELNIWVVLGSMHRLTAPNKPHNSLYFIDPAGNIAGRYDKRFCTPNDLDHYSPGGRFVDFEINGLKCSLLICFDLRFPEIYRKLRTRGVDCIFQSFYNARQIGPSIHTHIMQQSMQCRAATNYFWVSMANSSAPVSPYPGCFIQPDGEIIAQLKQNTPGMMINTIDKNKSFYDPTADFRDMAIGGALSNGNCPTDDPRSKDTTKL